LSRDQKHSSKQFGGRYLHPFKKETLMIFMEKIVLPKKQRKIFESVLVQNLLSETSNFDLHIKFFLCLRYI